MIKKGANPNHTTPGDKYNPIHFALDCEIEEDSKLETVKALIKGQANINAKTDIGGTPLFKAAQNGDFKIVKFLEFS